MSLTLRQMQYFVALADCGGFGAAAQRVNISQPALSLQVKAMEADLDAVLVERLPRGIRLTRAGQVVLERARRILTEVVDLEQAVRWRDGLSGRLHLGVIPTVAPYLLPTALTRLRATDLAMDLRVREAQTEVLLEGVLQGRLDAAVLALPQAVSGLIDVPLFDDAFLLAGSAARLNRWRGRADHLRPTEIEADQLLLLDEGHCLADQALEVCGLSRRRPVDLGASSLATLCGLVAEGFGLTLLPELAVRTEMAAAPGLALLRFAAPQPTRRLALVLRAGSEQGDWVRNLAQVLRDAGRAEQTAGHAVPTD